MSYDTATINVYVSLGTRNIFIVIIKLCAVFFVIGLMMTVLQSEHVADFVEK